MKNYFGLGDLIARLDAEPDKTRLVAFGFARPHSYRGYYEQLAFEPRENVTVQSMLDAARSALGQTFTGYKGGEYVMDEDADCWIAFRGCSGGDKIGALLIEFILTGGAPADATVEP